MSSIKIENIVAHNLGRISHDDAHKVKFILLNNGVLLFGKVEWHKDLMNSYTDHQTNVSVVAAGTIPQHIAAVDLSEENWGGWKSTGYGVLTPDEYRESIRNVLLLHEEEITSLSK
jgi:hypothetical protein